MARVQHMPVKLPSGVDVQASDGRLTVKSGKNALAIALPRGISIAVKANEARVVVDDAAGLGPGMGGTIRAHLNNMVRGVSKSFERHLTLVGVGYRAQAQGRKLHLSLGFSHPVEYAIPEGVQIETPSQTEIVVKGMDRHPVGQVAANVRAYRPPEPYKGKGVRYRDERIVMKEAKKK